MTLQQAPAVPLSEPCQDPRHWHLSELVEPFCDIPAWPFPRLPLHPDCLSGWEWDGVIPFFPHSLGLGLSIDKEDMDNSCLHPCPLTSALQIFNQIKSYSLPQPYPY